MMDIEELRIRKKLLEEQTKDAISKLLEEFRMETGVSPATLEIQTVLNHELSNKQPILFISRVNYKINL